MIDKKAWIKRAQSIDTTDEKAFSLFFKELIEELSRWSLDAKTEAERKECEAILANFGQAFEEKVKKALSSIRADYGVFE